MASGGATVDRLRDYLRDLPADSRSLLIAEFERKIVHGEDSAGADLVLKELRRLHRESRETTPRFGNAARLFYRPVEPFMVDDGAARRHPGRIPRAVLDQLWTWIRRDLLPDRAQQFTQAASEALLAGDQGNAELSARKFQDQAAAAIAQALDAAVDEKAKRRFCVQIATPHAEHDATTLMRILKMRDPLAMLADLLPGYIANLADTRLTETKGLIASAAARDPDIVVYALLIVMRRLAAPWQLIRLAPRSSGSLANAAETDRSYGTAVSVVLAELGRLTDELRDDLQRGGVATIGLLQNIHDAARGLRVELDPSPESHHARELAALRAQISELLQSQIESMPGRVRRLLRPRPSAEIRANSTLDADDVAETETLVGLVGACRQFAAELALNEMTQRSYSELQHYLDASTPALLDALRHAGPADRSFRQSQADAAVRFCRQIFGTDYAAMLARTAELAAGQKPVQQTGV
jgi:hypothetical protein